MFPFLIRGEHNVWIQAAYLVVERKNVEVIIDTLTHSKSWRGGKPETSSS